MEMSQSYHVSVTLMTTWQALQGIKARVRCVCVCVCVCARGVGRSETVGYRSHLLKQPNNEALGWHSAKSFFKSLISSPPLTFWRELDSCTPDPKVS